MHTKYWCNCIGLKTIFNWWHNPFKHYIVLNYSTPGKNTTFACFSLTGGLGGRPPLYGGGGRVRQMFEERRHQQQPRSSRISPIGWDKSYPLEPVQVSHWLGQKLPAWTCPGLSLVGTKATRLNLSRSVTGCDKSFPLELSGQSLVGTRTRYPLEPF
jgi:hypothetical protein